MDIVKILKSMSLTKMLYRNLLSPEERVMAQLQRKAVISSDSAETNQSDSDHVGVFESKTTEENKLGRLIGTGKLNKLLQKFAYDDEVESKTARILKGFYTANKRLLANGSEEERDHAVNKNIGNAVKARQLTSKYEVWKDIKK